MQYGSVIGIIFAGLVVLLKISGVTIPKISEPITNTMILVGLITIAITYGVSHMRKNS